MVVRGIYSGGGYDGGLVVMVRDRYGRGRVCVGMAEERVRYSASSGDDAYQARTKVRKTVSISLTMKKTMSMNPTAPKWLMSTISTIVSMKKRNCVQESGNQKDAA